MPMTGITSVKGGDAHPFYISVRTEAGFVPSWNFNKILISPAGEVVATYGSSVKPLSTQITGKIEAFLN